MDTAVALVEAYLRVNGYLTVTEYPVLEAGGARGETRAVSDLDVLAFRFPGAARAMSVRKHSSLLGDLHTTTDPVLQAPAEDADMIVGEVKRGRAHFNPATRRPEVMAFALRRFGCCHGEDAFPLAQKLLAHGSARTAHGHRVRMVVFGGAPPDVPSHNWHHVPLAAVTGFLQRHLEEHWDVLRHVHFSSDVLELMALLQRVKSVPQAGKTPAP